MEETSDPSDFERGMIVGARRCGVSVSETVKLLGFSRAVVCRVYKEWCAKQKTSSERKLCERKHIVNEKLIDSIIQENRMATSAEITAVYNSICETNVPEYTIRRTMKRMGYTKTATF